MAKLVTKFKYLKPGARQGRGGYAKYIATRDGVEKIDDTKRFAPTTWNQKQLINQILRDFPDSKEMLEYEDYLQKQTVESASEFISRAIEDNTAVALNAKTYADYIATRPHAERFGSHGLFTDDGVQVNLAKVSQELNDYGGNVWTVIISLRREDAERLGFDNGSRWRDMLRTQTQEFSENLRIPMGHLKWFAAFHNEGHHPHVHLIAYSTVESEGYLTKQGVQKLRSSFAKDIFAQDLLCIYEKQTEHRNRLRSESRDVLAEIVSQINAGGYSNPQLEELLLQLARRLSRTKGKKMYGYLKADVRSIVDSKVKQKGTKTEQGRYSSKYALTELLVCGECGTPYRRCTWTVKGEKKPVWRCINRLDFGKKYCHHSPTMEESVLQEAIMTAIMRTAKQSADVLGTLKLHIGMGLEVKDTEDNSLDIQIRIAEIDAEFKTMLQAIATDTVEDFDEQRATALMAEKNSLEQQLAQYCNVQQEKEKTESRLDEIFTILEGLENHPMEYDDRLARQVLECVVVESKDKIKVIFAGGLEVEQTIPT